MKPFPKLRHEAKHDARQRQLPALGVALLLALAAARGCAAAPAGPTVPEELRAAKLLAAALSEDAEGRRKLEKIYADLDAKHPRDGAVKNGRAEFLWSIGEQDRALEMWGAALLLEPKNAVVLAHLGSASLTAGEVKKAAAFYTRAVESAPQQARYRFALANVLFLFRHELYDAAQPDEAAVLGHALAHFAEASRLEPLNTEYARAYAETFYRMPKPDWEKALAAWRHLAEISPTKDFAHVNLARVHLNMGQKDAARSCLEKVHDADFQRVKARIAERIDSE